MKGGQRVLWSDCDVLDVLWAHRVKRLTASQLALTYGATRNAVCGLIHRVNVALNPADLDRLGDEALLRILDKVRGEGVAAEDAGAVFGLSRLATLALVHALMAEVAGPGDAQRPENRNGGMERHWYRAGLDKRREAA